MKLNHRRFNHDGTGQVAMTPEHGEDMWHLYNLLQIGDSLKSTAYRKVQQESATGTVATKRVTTNLTIKIEAIDFDSTACTLHVKGRNIEKNNFVSLGSYHTLDLEINRKFTLAKKHWDSVHKDRINEACDPARVADVAAVVMQEGLANVCLVLSSMTMVKAKIEVGIPRKGRRDGESHDKGVKKFYEQVMQAVVRHFNFEVVKCVIVASPGFVKDGFMEYLMREATQRQDRTILDNRSKFVCVHTTTGFVHSLKDALTDKQVLERVCNTKALEEIRLMERFEQMIVNDPDRAWYGMKHVKHAVEMGAVEVLLITDQLLRSQDIGERRELVSLVERVRRGGGAQVSIFSSLHPSGVRLAGLTGIAALLRFPLAEVDAPNESDSSDSDDSD